MSFLTVLMDKAAGKGKMNVDALKFELERIEAQIKKVKAEKESIEKSLASTKSAIAKEKEPSAAFNGVMSILKAKYK